MQQVTTTIIFLQNPLSLKNSRLNDQDPLHHAGKNGEHSCGENLHNVVRMWGEFPWRQPEPTQHQQAELFPSEPTRN